MPSDAHSAITARIPRPATTPWRLRQRRAPTGSRQRPRPPPGAKQRQRQVGPAAYRIVLKVSPSWTLSRRGADSGPP